MPKYIFQQSLIWEGVNSTADPKMPKHKIKTPKNKTAEDAEKKLPKARLGRYWILIDIIE